MNINSFFPINFIPRFLEKTQTILTEKNMKIALVASIIFTALTAIFSILKPYFSNSISHIPYTEKKGSSHEDEDSHFKDRFEGSFDKENTGKGKRFSFDGALYEGKFTDGKLNGEGVIHYKNGCIYQGEFVNDCLKNGKIIDQDGIVILEIE